MSTRQSPQNGFAILIVLVAVVILMLLYFVQIDAFFGPGLPAERAGLETHPWVLEELLIPEGEAVKLPRRPKLELEEPFSITALVARNENGRGEVAVAFEADGRIDANWQCRYEQAGVGYLVQAAMKGNIDVKRTYRDEAGKDKSRLFLIARGRFAKTPLDETAVAGGEKGTAWLIGWIGPDRSIQGHITLTTDRQWAAVYSFEKPR